MKNTTKTATQKALEFKREELKDIKATAKRAQSQLKKDVAALRYEMKTLRENGMQNVLDGVTTLDEIIRVTVGDQDLDTR